MIKLVSILLIAFALGFLIYFYFFRTPVTWRTYELPQVKISVPNTEVMTDEIDYLKVSIYGPAVPPQRFPFAGYLFRGEKRFGFDEGEALTQNIVLMIFPDRSYLKDPIHPSTAIGPDSWQFYANNSIMREGLWDDTSFELLTDSQDYKIFSYFRTILNQELVLISKRRPYVLAIQFRTVSRQEALWRLQTIEASMEWKAAD